MSEDERFAELMEWMEKDTLMRKQKFRDIKHYLELANERDATIVELDGQVEAFYKMGQQQAQELERANDTISALRQTEADEIGEQRNDIDDLTEQLEAKDKRIEALHEKISTMEKSNGILSRWMNNEKDRADSLQDRVEVLESRAAAEFVKKSNRFGAPNGG